MPVLNEATRVAALLDALRAWQDAGDEVIVVDGGSRDATVARAGAADRVLHAQRGRARQMNAGAAVARGRVLWFVHADSVVDFQARRVILNTTTAAPAWGRFDVTITSAEPAFRVIETLMNRRSRWSGIATGDQAVFVARAWFEKVAGYPPIPLMEDIELSRRLRRLGAPINALHRVGTSARRWRDGGLVRTVLLMWWLRAAWACGVSAERLARWYGYR